MIVESFLIITMATFNFTVMSGCSRANLLMLYSDFSTDNIKRMDSVCFLQVGEFASVMPQGVAENTITLPYNDSEAVRKLFDDMGDTIAAIIVEPVAGNMGCVPPEPG